MSGYLGCGQNAPSLDVWGMMFHSIRRPDVLSVTLAAAGILMVTIGTRQSFGLFISPINATAGMGIATISLALAIGQFTWGAIQPIAGAIADRYGSRTVLVVALITLAIGCAVTPFIQDGFGLAIALGLLASMGSGAGSFSVLIGATSQRLPLEARGTASGVINAGGSFGQFIFAPVLQKLIQSIGWMGAMWAMAVAALATLPLVGKLTGPAAAPSHHSENGKKLRTAVWEALKSPSYWLLHAGYFTCGFHLAFLATHLPGEVNLCGLPPSVASWSLSIIGLANIVSSIYVGSCITRYRAKYILAVMYGSRALLIAWYLYMPRTEWTFYAFALGLGLTWLSTTPPTAFIVSKLFGTQFLATLFGLTMLTHQIGGFLGAWLGGITISRFGDFSWMWYADIALAIFAALVNLPIKEAAISKT